MIHSYHSDNCMILVTRLPITRQEILPVTIIGQWPLCGISNHYKILFALKTFLLILIVLEGH